MTNKTEKLDHRLTDEEAHRRDCLARHMLAKKTTAEIRDWLAGQKKPVFREDMRTRLNTQNIKK